jgi:chemotaxis protein MotB
MEPGTPAKGAAVVLLVACGALGLYALQQKKAVDVHSLARGDLTTQLDTCHKSLDDEKKTREACEKTATDANATLTSSKAELDDLRKAKEDADKRAAVFKSITEKMKSLIDSGKLQVVMRHGRMIVKLPASVLFSSGSAELSKDGLGAVGEVARILRQFPDRQFEVAGHTDNIAIVPSPTSGFRTNLELSAGRAVVVAQALEKGGMNGAHLSAAGYAQFQPVASNKTEQGRQENRRIEIALVPNLAELSNLDADAGAP